MESRTEREAEPVDMPQPSQARADYLKEKVHTGDPGPIAPPRNVDVPYVSGNGTVGATLSCTMGNWAGMSEGTYAYAWSGGGVATGASYVVGGGDAGTSITCTVTATNAAGSTQAPPSNAVAIAAAQTESQTRRT